MLPSVVFSTDRSKAVVLMSFDFCMHFRWQATKFFLVSYGFVTTFFTLVLFCRAVRSVGAACCAGCLLVCPYLGRAKRIWYLSPMRAAKVQASLRIRAVSPEPSLLAHTSSESRRTFRQKARSLAPLNGWACAVKICHDGMLEDTNSLDAAHLVI